MASQRHPSEEQSALFDGTEREMRRRLDGARDQDGVFAALRWGLAELDRTFAATSAKVRAAVACRAGCDFCCRGPVGAQAHEVLIAADYVVNHFSPDEVAVIIERAGAHRARTTGLGAADQARLAQACPLLRDGHCSIYEARPESCRAHHSRDATVCEAYLADPTVPIQDSFIPALRGRMFAAMLGIDQAISDAGFDDNAYDFGSALHEALTNSMCAFLWARKKPAFPESCREPRMPEGS
jgi:Fe-S-cluster containining protein